MKDKQADLMLHLKEVVFMLNKIKRTNASERSETIAQLQNKIWDEPILQNEALDFLQDLAGDLNFYEPIERDRDTSLGYYDADRLFELTNEAIKKIEPLLAAR